VKRAIWPVLVLIALTACGGGDGGGGPESEPPKSPPAAEPQRITGRERIAWDQAGSPGEIAALGFAFYVDGARSQASDASCAPGGNGHVCSARLPAMSAGVHTIEVAAVVMAASGALESERSAPLRVAVGGSASVPTSTSSSDRAIQTDWGTPVRTADGVRLRVESVVAGLEEPTDLAFAPGGLVLVAERRGWVRVVRAGRLDAAPAVRLDDFSDALDQELLSLAIDPRFDKTRFVYLLHTARYSDAPIFRLVRLREAGGTLGEPVVLLDGVAARAGRAAGRVRVGTDGTLYVALDDGGAPELGEDLASFNGKLLRLNPDGSTPGDQPARSPIVAFGLRSPQGLDWSADSGAIVVADGMTPDVERLLKIDLRSPTWRDARLGAYELPHGSGVSDLHVYRGALLPALRGQLLLTTDRGGEILRAQLDPDGSLASSFEPLLEGVAGGVRVVAAGADGAVYFCTATGLGKLVPAL
jgi:glucose/arabinose dehydrogenase